MKKKLPPGNTVRKIPKIKTDKNFINGNLPSFPKRKVHRIKIPEKTSMKIEAILYDVINIYCLYPVPANVGLSGSGRFLAAIRYRPRLCGALFFLN